MTTIVIGYDGSEGSSRAVDLVASLPWEDGSRVTVVTATPDVRALLTSWGAMALRNDDELEREIRASASEQLAAPIERLRATGLDADGQVVAGHAPAVLVGEAQRTEADLLVLGSRGLGQLRSGIVGSVSMESIDRAPCPVLVARSASITTILFATDGSEDARAAELALARMPIARGVAVKVISVAERLQPWMTGVAPAWHAWVIAAQIEYEAEERQLHESIVADTLGRLREAGIEATGEALAGRPTSVVLDAAESVGADLIVLGTRGRTGLTRLVLGSVSRHIAHHTGASVLVARHG